MESYLSRKRSLAPTLVLNLTPQTSLIKRRTQTKNPPRKFLDGFLIFVIYRCKLINYNVLQPNA
jgi:hypothetical protein